MPKDELQKHTLNLYRGDFEELCALFPSVKPSVLVREIVRDCIKKHKEREGDSPSIHAPVEL